MTESDVAQKVIAAVKALDKLVQDVQKNTANVKTSIDELKRLSKRKGG